MQNIIVLECNEIPLRLFRKYSSSHPNSAIFHLLSNSLVMETVVQDVNEDFLYPSQTWASFNTGAMYELHKIHWYNDPKPQQYPLYWKLIANAGFSVGLVNTLHSSPAEEYATNNNYKFVIPDCFAINEYAKPALYQPFQRLNLKATSSNSRVSSKQIPFNELSSALVNFPRYGIRLGTVIDAISLFTQILTNSINKERLRNLQFPLIGDIFLHQLKTHKPNLSILFTNHVAANMHRYWYSIFPEDYSVDVYDEEWISKYSNEIFSSLDILDLYIAKLVEYSCSTKSVLILASSMGQHGNQKLPSSVHKAISHDFRLDNVRKFVDLLTLSRFDFKIETGMVPQYSLEFLTCDEAKLCYIQLIEAQSTLKNIILRVDINFATITLTVSLDSSSEYYYIRNSKLTYNDLGFTKFRVEDHHSGCHCPEGSLLIFNSSTSLAHSESINYLEFSPAILNHYEVDIPSYMVKPTFRI